MRPLLIRNGYSLFINELNMSDTLDTILPENNDKQEEATTIAAAPVADETEKGIDKLSKEEILAKLTGLVEASADTVRGEVDALKAAFYKIHHSEAEELKKAATEEGGGEEDKEEDKLEARLKELLATYKAKRAAAHAEEEQRRQANYALKLQLIERLKSLAESQEDFNKLYNEFKDIQQRWKEIKQVPQEYVNDLWRDYQLNSEKFYDIIKINNDFRDYDFKKNLETKTLLCETVEKLGSEPDIISSFHQLQKLHQQWRELGPVAREFREEIWTRFKDASTVINKRYQDHFELLKGKEEENLNEKTALCEVLEAIDLTLLKTFKDWEEKTKEVIALQAQWKAIGFASRKANGKIFERFRAVCDNFFDRKSEFSHTLKEQMGKNLELKKALCEQAEALKDSIDWKTSADKLINLQKEWKKIGTVGRRQSDAVWERFIAACDYFFEQKNLNQSSQKETEQANLAAKRELIDKINKLEEDTSGQTLSLLRAYMNEWNNTGFVPFREKDKIYKEYREAADKQFDRLKVDKNDRRMQSYRDRVSDLSSGDGKGKIYNERERMMRLYERMKGELQTYENNIGFLSISSKSGNSLLKDMEHKMEKIREEMEVIVKKIKLIDETI
ncbi:hypothetical protein Barb6_00369 [Bacteroidales bacterium Barb6]|nr:hypothetical protein Barb6_00369 [Bacteroidales bacterium Barb6]